MRISMLDYSSLCYLIEPMRVSDLDAVMEIELVSFSAPWSAKSYDYELHYNANAHYFVAREQPKTPPLPAPTRAWWQRWFRWNEPSRVSNGNARIVGYAGFWMMLDEAHISTIAAHPEWRRRGIGELLLLAMIRSAQESRANVLTLEVRVSNLEAQALYRKYGFKIVGERKAYYSDNREDALIMTTPRLDTAEYQRSLQARQAALLTRLSR